MPIDFRIDVKIPKLVVFNTRRTEAATRATIYPAMNEATLLLEREVKQRTPVGATAAARGSIQSATEMVRGRTLSVRGTVTSAQSYIVPLEKGSRPHWAPIGPLKLWARAKGGGDRMAYAVRAVIAKRGTRPAHMFRDGFRAAEPRIRRRLQEGVDAWVRYLRGR